MIETCSDLMRRAYENNWITARDGNISVRTAGQNHFYITPSGIRKMDLQPNMWKKIKVDTVPFSGHGIAGFQYGLEEMPYTEISEKLRPSGELPMHAQFQSYIGDDESRVVVHLHPTYCVAAMHKGIELSELCKDFPELSRYTSVAPNVPDVAPISEELGEKVAENMGVNQYYGSYEFDIVGIKGHGVVAVDQTPWRAFEHIERLEHICKIVLASGV